MTPSTPPPPVTPLPTSSSQAFDLVAAALHQVAGCIEEAGGKQATAAKHIRLGQMDQAFPHVSSALSLWQQAQGAMGAAANAIGQPVEALAALVLTTAGAAQVDPLADLTRVLAAIKRQVQGRDWIGLADSLEYDLGDLAQRWRAALLQPDEAGEPPSKAEPAGGYIAPAA